MLWEDVKLAEDCLATAGEHRDLDDCGRARNDLASGHLPKAD